MRKIIMKKRDNTTKRIPAEFLHFLEAPINCKDAYLVKRYIQQVYTERIENILDRKKEVPDADLMLIIADVAAEAPLDSDYTKIFEYLGLKETKHPFKELSSSTKDLYERSKRDLFYSFVKIGKKSPFDNIYTLAGHIILNMPEKFVKEVGVSFLMTVTLYLVKVAQAHKQPDNIIQNLRSKLEDNNMLPKDFPYSLHDVVDTVMRSIKVYIKEDIDYEK